MEEVAGSLRPGGSPGTDGGTLHLECSGAGSPIVLIHGVAGSQAIWEPLVPLLSATHTVVAVDLLGYGRSPTSRDGYSPESHTDAIRRSVREAGIDPPYTVVGLSMGANLALTYACRWPQEVEALVCIAFPYFADRAAALEGLRRNLWTRLVTTHPHLARTVIPAAWKGFRRSGLTRWHRGIYTPHMAYEALLVDYQAFRSSTLDCMLTYDCDAALACSGDLPRLFIHGSRDSWSSAGAVTRAVADYPASSFVVIDGAPHNVVVTAPRQTADAILEHLHRLGHRAP